MPVLNVWGLVGPLRRSGDVSGSFRAFDPSGVRDAHCSPDIKLFNLAMQPTRPVLIGFTCASDAWLGC